MAAAERLKGWFKIDGVQDGDRTADEQIVGALPAIREAKGKMVLDLGCAEGLIGREFARAGAAHVLGVDAVDGHLMVALEQCRGLPMEFQRVNLNHTPAWPTGRFDIVLALGIIHKLRQPGHCLARAAEMCGSLLLLRSGLRVRKGIIDSKTTGERCDSHAILKAAGFRLEHVEPGARNEHVEFWRRC